MKIVISFVPTDFHEINLERNNRKANVSSVIIHSNSSKFIRCFWPIFAISKTNFLVQTLVSQRNMNQIECFIGYFRLRHDDKVRDIFR